MKTNVLYYGDNLDVLRHHDYFPDASVDLIYLDPPFNSNRSYNMLSALKDSKKLWLLPPGNCSPSATKDVRIAVEQAQRAAISTD